VLISRSVLRDNSVIYQHWSSLTDAKKHQHYRSGIYVSSRFGTCGQLFKFRDLKFKTHRKNQQDATV